LIHFYKRGRESVEKKRKVQQISCESVLKVVK